MKKSITFSTILIIISLVLALYFYNIFPDKIISHWNAKGEADGYAGRFSLFLMPIVMLGILVLFWAIPKIDPLKKNIKRFDKYYNLMIIILELFFFYMFILVILANLGYFQNINYLLVPVLAILFYFLGVIIENSKRNWFVGIRTPWTLSNEKVWDKTHKLGGLLFKICAALVLIGIFFQDYFIWFVLIPILLVVIILFIYSYLEFSRLKKT